MVLGPGASWDCEAPHFNAFENDNLTFFIFLRLPMKHITFS